MARLLLSDDEWKLIEDVFPEPAATGRPPRDPRVIVNAILWVLRTGAPWRDLPEEFGPWQTAWRFFDRWTADGTLEMMLRRLQSAFVDIGQIDDELWCIDGTVVRAHRCAAGGGKKGQEETADHALGRSRGGFPACPINPRYNAFWHAVGRQTQAVKPPNGGMLSA